MPAREPHKFDPARASVLDAAERDAYLPDDAVADLLDLGGDETVLDYGAGTGRVSLVVARRLPDGRVIAVDESAEMIAYLARRLEPVNNAEVLQIENDAVPLDGGSVDRILAVNILHEVLTERALAEMLRLLRPGGSVLVIDWNRDRPSEPGPPVDHRYGVKEAILECERAGFEVEPLAAELPYHFALRARRPVS